MQKRQMNAKEQQRERVIQELVRGAIDGTEAAHKLQVSIRQIKRLKKNYLEQGSQGLIHGMRGTVGSRKTKSEVEEKVIEIIRNHYHDFGPRMATEKLAAIHGIKLDDETIRQMMIRAGLWKGRKRRSKEYHCWRERRAHYGELQQFDGSYHDWFEGRNPDIPEACLLASIDDATGKITKAVFAPNEGVEAVMRFWWEYILVHGIPQGVYLDKFSTYKINHQAATDNHDLMTQFQRAAKTVLMGLITAHSPQAKGRIERLFKTLQDRLVKELRLHGISTIAEANVFLETVFIPWFNDMFAVVPKGDKDMHIPISEALRKELPSIFAQHHTRLVNSDFTIQFHNTWYQLEEVQPVTVYKRDKVLIEERLDGTIHFKYKDAYLKAFALPEKPKKLKKEPTILTTHRLNWKPAPDHPWRNYITSSA